MTESAAYTYRLTEEGDLILGGVLPEYNSPELYPHYEHRDRVLRVVTLPGARIAARAFAGYPNLRVAVLSEATAIADAAFAGCPMLGAIQLSPRTLSVAPDAFADCPRLFCIDYAGARAELESLARDAFPALDTMVVRTLPSGGAEVASGRIGDAEWRLDDAGVLTVVGASVPALFGRNDAPWYLHLDKIRHVVIGEGVARVGERVFSAMPAFSALTVVGDTEISDFAFASCDRLTRIELFCAVTRVGLCAFAGVGVREMMLPPSLRKIPEGLLQSAFSLRVLVLPLLPAAADAPFLTHCEALTDIKKFVVTGDRRKLNTALCLPPRTRITSFDPKEESLSEIDKAFHAAEFAIRTAAASYTAAREAQELPIAHAPRLSPVIDEAEREYLSLERFRFEPDGTIDTVLEATSYKKRVKILKEREKERKEARKEAEAKTEKSYKRLTEHFDSFYADLKRAADASAKEEKELLNASRLIAAAEATVVGHYPLDSAYRTRAAALREGVAGFAAALPPDVIPNAMMAVSEYKMLIEYRRFDELRNSLSRAMLLLNEHRTVSTEAKEGGHRVPPCILVAGGDPEEDRSTAACIRALRRAGAVVEWAKPDDHRLGDRNFDALLICDGDSAAAAYGGFSHGLRIDEKRARRDSTLFSAFFLYGKPIMGIGRGAQQINLYLCGTMRWNMSPSEREAHMGKNGKPVAHTITVTPDNALSEMYDLGGIPMRVLSDHSSAIRTLGRELVPVAKTRDGVIEAFVHRRVPLIGVQFPIDRMLTDAPKGFVYPAPAVDDGMTLFTAFVDLCRRVREKPPVAGSEARYSKRERG